MTELIVALDYASQEDALALVDVLNPNQCALKVGSEMFTRFGPDFISALIARDFRIFLDLKFHDIPNTVAKAVTAAAELGVWMVNVHALGGVDMMVAAHRALESFRDHAPLLIAVTILTSMKASSLETLGLSSAVEHHAIHLAGLAYAAGLQGVVCAASEAGLMKKRYGENFLTITPGIRPNSASHHDQHRTATPLEAVAFGSDFLVMGRPITQALDPAIAVSEILAMIRGVQSCI